jgi:hypothetical protein
VGPLSFLLPKAPNVPAIVPDIHCTARTYI